MRGRVSFRLNTFILFLLMPLLLMAMGLLVVLIGALESNDATIAIGIVACSLAITGLLNWLPEFREIEIEENGINIRKWGRDRIITWDKVSEALVTSVYISHYYSKPGGVSILLKKRGYFGVRKSIDIPDVFNIRKLDLARIINSYCNKDGL